MRVSEAIKNWSEVLGKEIEVQGVAEISHRMSVIYEDRDKKEIGNPMMPGILVHGGTLRSLAESLPIRLAACAGSEVLYIVKVRVLGIVANTGYRFAPLKFGHIYEIEFDDERAGTQLLKVNAHLKDIVLKIKRSLNAKEVKEFERYFPSFGNMIKLKKYLESGQDIVLASRVIEPELSEYIGFLEKLNVEYRLDESPIENGLWGMP